MQAMAFDWRLHGGWNYGFHAPGTSRRSSLVPRGTVRHCERRLWAREPRLAWKPGRAVVHVNGSHTWRRVSATTSLPSRLSDARGSGDCAPVPTLCARGRERGGLDVERVAGTYPARTRARDRVLKSSAHMVRPDEGVQSRPGWAPLLRASRHAGPPVPMRMTTDRRRVVRWDD